jgi:hypothetical protein
MPPAAVASTAVESAPTAAMEPSATAMESAPTTAMTGGKGKLSRTSEHHQCQANEKNPRTPSRFIFSSTVPRDSGNNHYCRTNFPLFTCKNSRQPATNHFSDQPGKLFGTSTGSYLRTEEEIS